MNLFIRMKKESFFKLLVLNVFLLSNISIFPAQTEKENEYEFLKEKVEENKLAQNNTSVLTKNADLNSESQDYKELLSIKDKDFDELPDIDSLSNSSDLASEEIFKPEFENNNLDGNLSKLQTFSALELEDAWHSHSFDWESEQLHDLLYAYDLKQPTEKFSLNGKTLRVASFNLNRGYNLEKLKLIFEPDAAFEEILEEFPEISETETYKQATAKITQEALRNGLKSSERIRDFDDRLLQLLDPDISNFTRIFPTQRIKKAKRKYKFNYFAGLYELAKEMNHLANADLIALQEVDWGMPRTNYVHVTKEIAKATGMGYAFGTEFIEFQDDGKTYSKVEDLDENSFKGLHGNAILSKWPIENVKVYRFNESFTEDPSLKTLKHRRCYDWWKEELARVGPFESLIYKFGEIVFKEKAIVPSVRAGSRMALIADIETPAGFITFISTHLENRGSPKCRRAQVQDILEEVKSITDRPIVIGGDLNTTQEEARRPYFRHAVYWYIKNQFELSTLAASLATGTGLYFLDLGFPILNPIPALVQFVNQMREWRNPPGIGSAERKLFRKVIQKFRFDDGTVFDTRGEKALNQRKSKRFLSDSNQTTPIGYKPTYCFQRNYKKLFCMKLDWIFVKANLNAQTRKRKNRHLANNAWAPSNPRTLFYSTFLAGLSDHAAITTDLLLPEYDENN